MSIPTLLQGLQTGTVHMYCRLDGSGATALVAKFEDNDCSLFCDLPEITLALSQVQGVIQPYRWTHDLSGHWRNMPIVLRGSSPHAGDSVGDRGWTTCGVGAAHLGVPAARTRWTARLRSSTNLHVELTLPGASLRVVSHPKLHRADVSISSATGLEVDDATDLMHDLMWILQLISPSGVGLVAVWAVDRSEGLTTFDAASQSINHTLISEDRALEFVSAAAASWTAASDDDRQVLRSAIDMLVSAANSKLETSIVLTAAALELMADVFLPRKKGQHVVPKPARKAILSDIEQSAQAHAPGTEFASRSKEIGSWLFNRTTKERFKELRSHYGLSPEPSGVDQFVKMRNKVVHGGFQKEPYSQRRRAMLFGRWMLGACLARQLGYDGLVRDWRRL